MSKVKMSQSIGRCSNCFSRSMLNFILLIIINVSALGTYSFALSPFQPTQLSIERYSVDNGLSTNHIQCIFQDNKGFMWFGTPIGLIRYDGYNFSEFRHSESDSTSIGKGAVWAICEDNDSNLWIGTHGGGLNFFDRDKESFIHYQAKSETGKSVNDNNINALICDINNKLWIGTGSSGLNCFDLKSGIFSYYKNSTKEVNTISNNAVMSLLIDNENKLWIGTWGGGLNMFDEQNKKFSRFSFDIVIKPDGTSNVVWTIYQDKQNGLWIGTWGSGLLSFNKKTKLFKQFRNNPSKITSISDNIVMSVNEDNFGNFWVGTISSLNLLDKANGTFSIPEMSGKQSNENLAGSSIYSLINDRQGILWIGTFGQGINVWDKNKYKFDFHQLDPDLKGNWVNCACNDESGNIWLGTGENGIVKYEKKLGRFDIFKQSNAVLPNKFVNAICNFNRHKILFSTYKGLFLIDKKTGKISVFNNENQATNTNIKQFDSRFIYLNKGYQIIRYDTEKETSEVLLAIDTLPNITSFIVRKDSTIWLGTDNKGLIICDLRNGHQQKYLNDPTNQKSIGDNSIRCLFEDKIGNVWIGTSLGLNKFDPKNQTFTFFQEKDGLANATIEDVTDDKNGNIWISTLNGISLYEPDKKLFTNFDRHDGLPDKSPRFFKINESEIVMTGSKGFSFLYSEKISRNEFIPSVIITEFKLFSKPVFPGAIGSPLQKNISETQELVLNYKQSVLTFSWVGLNYRFPEANQYAYKMDGLDVQWNYVGTSRSANFNLNPGEYNLHIKASNNDGIWNETGVSIKITILPPFWQTRWFISLLIVGFLASLYSWYLMRVRHLKNQNLLLQDKVAKRTEYINQQKELLQDQKEELIQQADNLQSTNFLMASRGEELESIANELKTQGDQLYTDNEELIRINATKDRLFAIVVHDLRNPFNAIIGFSELLTRAYDSLTDGEKRKMLQNIHTSSINAYKLLENLLDWARSQTNSVEFNPTQISILAIARNVKQLLELQAETKNIRIELSMPQEINAFADSDMTETIIRNLVSNAIKFTPEGGQITISAKSRSAIDSFAGDLKSSNQWMKSIAKGNFIEISVRDNGIGMPLNVIENLFRLDVPHKTAGTSGERGTGLGLLICSEFAEKNSGKILVESQAEKGSTFYLYLPNDKNCIEETKILNKANVKSVDRPEEIQLSDEVMLNSIGEKYLILIAEDNTELREYVANSLKSNYQVIEASNGKRGFSLALERIPDLIISDLMMPEMDGLELCSLIKSDERTSHIPFIILTAKIGDENQLIGLKNGANDYLNKPFNIQVLTVKVRNILRMQQRMREHYSSQVFLSPTNVPITNIDEIFIKRAIGIVENNMSDEGFNVERFSEQLNMSHIQLYRKLNALANISPTDFIRTIRLKRAAQLIIQGQLNINQVCFETGFNNHSYFTKCFKKEFGVLPKEYTSRHKD